LGLCAIRLDPARGVTYRWADITKVRSDVLDLRTIYVNVKTARGLFALSQGVTQIALRLEDLWVAPAFARKAANTTGLEATPWTATNKQLLSGLDAQARSGNIIKGFPD